MTKSLEGHPQQNKLLAAILSDPADDAARLVYADCLDEHDDPLRAEFIRCQVAIAAWEASPGEAVEYAGGVVTGAQAGAALARSQELLDAYRVEWFSLNGRRPWSNAMDDVVWLTGGGDGWESYLGGKCRRGFVETVTCGWPDWQKNGDALLRFHPIREVKLTSWPPPYFTLLPLRSQPNPPGRVGQEKMKKRLVARWPGIEFILPEGPAGLDGRLTGARR